MLLAYASCVPKLGMILAGGTPGGVGEKVGWGDGDYMGPRAYNFFHLTPRKQTDY